LKIFYVAQEPEFSEHTIHLRIRHLYGPDLLCLNDPQVQQITRIGPIWSRSPRWPFRLTPIAEFSGRVAAFMKEQSDGVLVVANHEIAIALLEAGVSFAFDPTDSSSLFYRRRISAALIGSPHKIANSYRLFLRYQNFERRILGKVSCFVTSGRADEAWLRHLNPTACIIRVDNGTELIELPAVTPRDDGRTVGFHGSMSWEPNHTAANILSGQIARNLAALPGQDIRISIAGRNPHSKIQKRHGRNGVEIIGYVDDLGEWLSTLTLYVMPMVLGAGVKNKLIEALAAGVPVLTNERGAESLPSDCLSAVAIVKSEKEWARRIRDLLSRPDELQRLRREARKCAVMNFNWQEHRQKLHDVFKGLRKEGLL
jgi:glycosyltransferase involved in cell wall biosynthesis